MQPSDAATRGVMLDQAEAGAVPGGGHSASGSRRRRGAEEIVGPQGRLDFILPGELVGGCGAGEHLLLLETVRRAHQKGRGRVGIVH